MPRLVFQREIALEAESKCGASTSTDDERAAQRHSLRQERVLPKELAAANTVS